MKDQAVVEEAIRTKAIRELSHFIRGQQQDPLRVALWNI